MIASSEHGVTVRGVPMRSRTFVFGDNQQIATALYSDGSEPRRLLRVQYGCLFGTTFDSGDCDCAHQVRTSIRLIGEAGGVLIYFRDHEAFGLGIFEKAQILAREQVSIEAHRHAMDKLHRNPIRHSVISFVPEILATIETPDLVLLGNNKEKLSALRRSGIKIASVKPLPPPTSNITPFAHDELAWKAAYSGNAAE